MRTRWCLEQAGHALELLGVQPPATLRTLVLYDFQDGCSGLFAMRSVWRLFWHPAATPAPPRVTATDATRRICWRGATLRNAMEHRGAVDTAFTTRTLRSTHHPAHSAAPATQVGLRIASIWTLTQFNDTHQWLLRPSWCLYVRTGGMVQCDAFGPSFGRTGCRTRRAARISHRYAPRVSRRSS